MSEKFSRILIPLDGSNLAESVLPFSVAMAARLQATIVLLHIIEEHAPQTVHGEPHLHTVADAEQYLLKLASRYGSSIICEHHVHGTEEDNVAGSIASHISELKADMVVLCTHGGSGLRRVVSGSIAQQVLRKATAPVLIMRPRLENAATAIKSILVPLDGTHASERAVQTAAYLARACDASLSLVTVVPTVETVKGNRTAAARMSPLMTAEVLNAEEEQSRVYLEGIAADLRGQGIAVNAVVRRGNTVPTLAEAAAQTPTDLIIIATHGRAGLNAMWTGSVTATLIARVAQPTLMLKLES